MNSSFFKILIACFLMSACTSSPEATDDTTAKTSKKNAGKKKGAKPTKKPAKKSGEDADPNAAEEPGGEEVFALDEDGGNLLDEEKKELTKPRGSDTPDLLSAVKKLGPGKSLPLPEKVNLFAVTNFLDQYKTAYKQYSPLIKEYKLYFNLYARSVPASDQEEDSARFRIKEDFARAHWAYVKGLHELLEFLTQRTNNVLLQDIEENFVLRMKVLTFLAKELHASSTRSDYLDFTRRVYMSLSIRHFGRELEEVKPSEKKGDPKSLD